MSLVGIIMDDGEKQRPSTMDLERAKFWRFYDIMTLVRQLKPSQPRVVRITKASQEMHTSIQLPNQRPFFV